MTDSKTAQEVKELMNSYGQQKTPFLFIIDFDQRRPQVYPLSEVPDENQYVIQNQRSVKKQSSISSEYNFRSCPHDSETYKKGFEKVMKHINYGNSFLLNLTYPSEVQTDLSLEQIFDHSQAAYKLWIKDQLVVFSPESFVQIKGNKISSYPMKGTIKADIPDAKQKLIDNEKELAEHYTIVDLIRNDLSIVARKVSVERFRYLQKIEKPDGDIWQASSEITGELKSEYQNKIGDLLFTLLPAGSISGAPKKKTVEIINDAEIADRGYYTGVFGIYDGHNLDSGVMIRCIQKKENQLFYHSGGGITHMSNLEEEYTELIDKIYVPII